MGLETQATYYGFRTQNKKNFIVALSVRVINGDETSCLGELMREKNRFFYAKNTQVLIQSEGVKVNM